MIRLTPRQDQIVDFIMFTLAERGFPPTVREIGAAVGLSSSSSVHAQLAALSRLGVLRRVPHSPRAIEVVLPPSSKEERLMGEKRVKKK